MSTAQATEHEHDQDAVLGVVRRFSRAFDNFDTDAFLSTWDSDAPSIVYPAEELSYALFGFDALRVYFTNLPNVIRDFRDIKVLDMKIAVDGDYATVYVRFSCRISFAAVPQVSDGQIRQSFVLRRRMAGWRIVHYHESRQAAGMEAAVGEW
jgi:ketosteroid isomerase-like protein